MADHRPDEFLPKFMIKQMIAKLKLEMIVCGKLKVTNEEHFSLKKIVRKRPSDTTECYCDFFKRVWRRYKKAKTKTM